jgi:hypothetical protein
MAQLPLRMRHQQIARTQPLLKLRARLPVKGKRKMIMMLLIMNQQQW